MRGILSVFVVAWLNLAMQPCAMALGDRDEHDCARCPPAHDAGQSDHAMHGSHMAAEEAAAVEMPCAIAATDCSLLDELNHDGRVVKLDVNNPADYALVGIAPPIDPELDLRPAENLGWHSGRSPPPSSSVPLNVYYCVYLK